MSGQLNLSSLFHCRGTCAVITQLTPRTYCRLPWHVIAWGSPGVPTWSPRTTTCSTSAISQQCGTVLMFQLRTTVFQPSIRRWALRPMICQPVFSRHGVTHRVSLNLGTFCFPRPHGHPEHRRQDVHHPHLQLCTAVFCRGHGVGDSRNPGMSVVRWFFSSRRESHGSGCAFHGPATMIVWALQEPRRQWVFQTIANRVHLDTFRCNCVPERHY